VWGLLVALYLSIHADYVCVCLFCGRAFVHLCRPPSRPMEVKSKSGLPLPPSPPLLPIPPPPPPPLLLTGLCWKQLYMKSVYAIVSVTRRPTSLSCALMRVFLPPIPPARSRTVVRNQSMSVFPPLEAARVHWTAHLNVCVGIICDQPRLQSRRYDTHVHSLPHPTYRQLLTYVPACKSVCPLSLTSLLSLSLSLASLSRPCTVLQCGCSRLPPSSLSRAYEVMQNKLEEVAAYVGSWLRFQSLWDMDTNVLHHVCGNDLAKWQQLLADIKTGDLGCVSVG